MQSQKNSVFTNIFILKAIVIPKKPCLCLVIPNVEQNQNVIWLDPQTGMQAVAGDDECEGA